MSSGQAREPGLCLGAAMLMLVMASAVGTTFGASKACLDDVLAGALRQERVFRTPGGATLIEQWTVDGESLPLVVRAQRYVSGLSLAPRLALVFHAHQRVWMLSLDGRLTALTTLSAGDGSSLPLSPDTPVLDHYVFDHAGQRWHLAILVRRVQIPLPGVATEQEQTLIPMIPAAALMRHSWG